jgi:hypothetical protein
MCASYNLERVEVTSFVNNICNRGGGSSSSREISQLENYPACKQFAATKNNFQFLSSPFHSLWSFLIEKFIAK